MPAPICTSAATCCKASRWYRRPHGKSASFAHHPPQLQLAKPDTYNSLKRLMCKGLHISRCFDSEASPRNRTNMSVTPHKHASNSENVAVHSSPKGKFSSAIWIHASRLSSKMDIVPYNTTTRLDMCKQIEC